jgi:hypothetical protein
MSRNRASLFLASAVSTVGMAGGVGILDSLCTLRFCGFRFDGRVFDDIHEGTRVVEDRAIAQSMKSLFVKADGVVEGEVNNADIRFSRRFDEPWSVTERKRLETIPKKFPIKGIRCVSVINLQSRFR